MYRIISSLLILAFLPGCRLFHKKAVVNTDYYQDSAVEYTDYNGEGWTGENEILFSQYRASEDKIWDLQHTVLNLSFDFGNRSVSGLAILTLHPHWDSTSRLTLDARNMEINELVFHYSKTSDHGLYNTSDSTVVAVPFQYSTDSQQITIQLPFAVPREQSIQISMQYIARPYNHKLSGNAAISGDRGLYFINHDLKDPGKPRQLWTQGETESNSHWFPTLDAPNQKTTLDITLEVPDTMISLSNGTLVSSKPAPKKGFHLDHWVQKQPHAPYLTMVAMGNWALVKDSWRGKQVNYLLEKPYEPYAKLIFGNTPAMLEFFSNYLGVDFAWDKYSQVVVRDFVSGAMENTTATVHMEALQHTAREHADETYEDYISHELFHQWFGDLVTTESWSNITLNESFATYGEYLWREHFYGPENALGLLQDLQFQYRYLRDAEGKHLVRYDWENDGELFDNVSYQKGACILHMLRYTVGDEAFRESLKRYLQKYRFSTAEVANLRLCFEEVTGKDLNWFFNQWYFSADHPDLNLNLEAGNEGHYGLRVEQTQQNRNTYAFKTSIQYSVAGVVKEKDFFVSNRIQFLDLETTTEPDWYIFDPTGQLLCDLGVQNPNVTTATQNLKKINKAWPAAGTAGQLRLLQLAGNILQAGFEGEDGQMVEPHAYALCMSALQSSNNQILNHGLDLLNYLNAEDKLKSETSLHKIAGNRRLQPDTRKEAISKLYYNGLPDQTLLELTRDSSLQVASYSVILLHQPSIWVPYALNEGLSDPESQLAAIWARKLISYSSQKPEEVLEKLSANPNVKITDFGQAVNSLFYYVDGNNQSEVAEKLAVALKSSNRSMALKVLLFTLESEIGQIEQEIRQNDDFDPGLLEELNARKADFSRIISTFS